MLLNRLLAKLMPMASTERKELEARARDMITEHMDVSTQFENALRGLSYAMRGLRDTIAINRSLGKQITVAAINTTASTQAQKGVSDELETLVDPDHVEVCPLCGHYRSCDHVGCQYRPNQESGPV